MFQVRGNSSRARGLPRLSPMIWSQTAASSGPYQVVEQQRPGIAVSEPSDGQLRQPSQDVIADTGAGRAHQRDLLGQQAAGHEPEDLRGGVVEPLGVIDDADQRLGLGDLGQQRQGGQPDQEPVRGVPLAQPERRAERIALRARQTVEVLQHRCAQLMQPGERELHLGFDPRRSRDATA